VEDDLERMRERRRYFVLRRDETACVVQVLNPDGTARAQREYRDAVAPLEVGGETVPVEVLQAGLRQPAGKATMSMNRARSIPPW
jgi:hypothetical protein